MSLIKDKVRLLDIKTSRMVDSIFIGNYKTRFKGQGIEFADFREYEPGDDVKNIDWVTSARQNKIFIKKYIEERLLKSIFLVDVGEGMNFGIGERLKKDIMIEVFTMLAFSSIKNGDMVGALIYDNGVVKFFPPKKGKLNILVILKCLFSIFESESYKNKLKSESARIYGKIKNKDGDRNINLAFDFLVKHKIKNYLVFALTDQIKNIDSKKIKVSGIKNDFVYINVFDEFENKLNFDGIFNFVGLGSFIQIYTGNEKLREKYTNLRSREIDLLKKELLKSKIDYLSVDNKTNIFSYFYKYFKFKETAY